MTTSANDGKATKPGRLLDGALTVLRARSEELQARGFLHVAIFGSVARREDGPDSDLDLVVVAGPEVDSMDAMRVEKLLAADVGREVQIISRCGLDEVRHADIFRDNGILAFCSVANASASQRIADIYTNIEAARKYARRASREPVPSRLREGSTPFSTASTDASEAATRLKADLPDETARLERGPPRGRMADFRDPRQPLPAWPTTRSISTSFWKTTCTAIRAAIDACSRNDLAMLELHVRPRP